MTATFIYSGFELTMKRLVGLLDIQEEYPEATPPTSYAFTTALKLVIQAYDLVEERFPPAWAETDNLGG